VNPSEIKVGDRVVLVNAPPMHGTVRYVHEPGVHVWVDWDLATTVRRTPEQTNAMAVLLLREEPAPVDDPDALRRWLDG
jgi:hypothetical protein